MGGVIYQEDVLDLLIRLAEKSLLTGETEDGRYRMLETVRDYALEHLLESGESADVQAKHCKYFLELAERVRRNMFGPNEDQEGLDVLAPDMGNLRSALGWALALEAAMMNCPSRSVATFFTFGFIAALHEKAGTGTIRALEIAQNQHTQSYANALSTVGTMEHSLGDFGAAKSHFKGALALSRELGNRGRQVAVLNNLGLLAIQQRDFEAATANLREALAISKKIV